MKYSYSDQSLKYMAGNAITESDIKQVINKAEESGVKAVNEQGTNLAKLVIGPVTIYVQYKIDSTTGFNVEQIYSHRVKLIEKE